MNKILLRSLILTLLWPSSLVWAQQFADGSREIFEVYRNVRALGMGGAYTAVVDDGDSVFINPAGLAKNSGIYWTVMDPGVGISDPEGLTNFADLQSSSDFSTALNNIMGKYFWAGGNGKSLFYMPFLAVGYYAAADVSFVANNPVNPEIFFNYIQDTGLVVATGFGLFPFLDIGLSLRKVDRTGQRARFGPSVINDIVNNGSDPSIIFNQLTGTMGTGYGLDFGANITVDSPIQPTLSFVWKDIGNTQFYPADSSDPRPPKAESEMIVGAAVSVKTPIVSVTPSIDIKHLNRTDQQLGKKIHFGIELDLPFLDLRAGLYQGYLSYGAGLDLGIMRVDAASWGVEVGAFPGQIEDRRYAVQATFEFGLDLGSGGDGKGGKGKNGRRSGGDRRVLKIRR